MSFISITEDFFSFLLNFFSLFLNIYFFKSKERLKKKILIEELSGRIYFVAFLENLFNFISER